jgi:hypothetical protein
MLIKQLDFSEGEIYPQPVLSTGNHDAKVSPLVPFVAPRNRSRERQ